MADLDRYSLYDPDDVECFGGAHPVLAVSRDGQLWPWLLGDPDGPQGCACPEHAPHEQLGRLPAQWRRQVNQCQAIATTTRRRCTNPAPSHGRYCHVHASTVGGGVDGT